MVHTRYFSLKQYSKINILMRTYNFMLASCYHTTHIHPQNKGMATMVATKRISLEMLKVAAVKILPSAWNISEEKNSLIRITCGTVPLVKIMSKQPKKQKYTLHHLFSYFAYKDSSLTITISRKNQRKRQTMLSMGLT